MSQSLKSIRILFSSYLIATVLGTVAVFWLCLVWEDHSQREVFYQNMPTPVRVEYERLIAAGEEHGSRADAIYDQYWPSDRPGVSGALIAGLVVSLLIGLGIAYQTSRAFMQPVVSVAEAAVHISEGNYSIRASLSSRSGALSELVQNFNAMANALENLESYRKEMLAAISHELRTPLTILRGRLHAICDGVTVASPEEHLRLLGQAEHLVRLVEDLDTLALAEAGQLSLHRVRTDLGSFIHELEPVYSARAGSLGVRLETDIVPVWAMVDRSRLQQVLANLVENALRYGASGKYMRIRLEKKDDRAILEIEDHGPGLPAGALDQVFEPFFRVDSSRSRATGGSGLGLAIVRMLIRMHDGTVEADRSPSGGAIFRISLPIAQD
ncbi:MAG TPA: ATP-binding protein [Moraxellaceae bacterium]|nr:ATP-binding protein [Moraxellaceae bacterium]